MAEIVQFDCINKVMYVKYKRYLQKLEFISQSTILNVCEVKNLDSINLLTPISNISKKLIRFELSFSLSEERRRFAIPFLHYYMFHSM